MNNQLRISPAFRYIFQGYLRSAGMFAALTIMIFVALGIIFGITSNSSSSVNMNGASFQFASLIFIMVVGIVSIREDLRMLIQHGIGRKTSFIASCLAAMAIALSLAVFSEIINAAFTAITSGQQNITVYSWISMLLPEGEMGFSLYLLSIVISFSFLLGAYFMGMFISLVFYRLSKSWRLVVAIGVPAFFIIILPLFARTAAGQTLFGAISRLLLNMAELIAQSAWYLVLFALAFALVFAFFSRLLTRRAAIQPAA